MTHGLLVDDGQRTWVCETHGTHVRVGTRLIGIVLARTKHFRLGCKLRMDLEADSGLKCHRAHASTKAGYARSRSRSDSEKILTLFGSSTESVETSSPTACESSLFLVCA